MCGRYASSRRPDELIDEFDATAHLDHDLEASWNVAPTDEVFAVMEHPKDEERQLRVVRWGLVPSWAKERSIGPRMINARLETLAEKPAFRKALAVRRCLVPADGYYEWYPTEELDAKGKARKQPFFIRPTDGGVLPMAGLYELWRDPDKADDAPDRWLWTCTVITTEATDELGMIHDRMPLMVERDRWDAWLDPTREGAALLDLLEPAAPGRLTAYPVSTAVGNVRHNGPELVAPLPLEA